MSAKGPLVLVIDDDPQIVRYLRTILVRHGFRVQGAGDAATGLESAREHMPDLILLDLTLPDRDGLDLLRELRVGQKTPIVVLSVRDRAEDKVHALDNGADDYVIKPFDVDELLARIRLAFRHAAEITLGRAESVFSVGELRVELARREVFVGEREVHLTPKEYQLIATLVKHAGKVVTHRQLLTEIWGAQHAEDTHYLRVFMAQIRQKLEPDPAKPRYLINEPRVGYRLKVR